MNKRPPHDQMLYCERCGISFLWSSEEQEQDTPTAVNPLQRPDLCPGCRKLLPVTERERGLVKWFNYRKRYGFLARAEGPDLFVHRSELAENTRLRPGDLVEFTVTNGERGPAAGEVILLVRDHTPTDESAET